jgi:hypothetical protein
MFDTGGLFLLVWTGGGKLRGFRYRYAGKGKLARHAKRQSTEITDTV